MKRILCFVISIILSLTFMGCTNQTVKVADDVVIAESAAAENVNAESATAESATDEVYELQEELLALPNVASVEMISQNDDEFLAQYLIIFNQPIDWTDYSKGTFPQRVLLGYKGKDHLNSFEVGGYCFADYIVPGIPIIAGKGELSSLYDGNCIMIEYRYFGDSKPVNDGADYDSAEYWACLTTENANSDFSNIIHTMKAVLPAKSFFSGVSKGGFSTNAFCMYEDDDSYAAEYKQSVMNYGKWESGEQYIPTIDAYISYDAPLCDGPEDPRFMTNLFETIGNQGYDLQTAQDKRDLVMEFLIEALKYRDPIQDWYYQKSVDDGNVIRPFCTKEVLYDVAVLEFATQFWQYGTDISYIENVLSMSKSGSLDTEETDEYATEIYNLIVAMNDPSSWSPSSIAFPYYVQAACEMGEHSLDFSYLRKELADRGLEDALFITEEMEDHLLQKMVFSEDMLNNFSYKSELRDRLMKWARTTTAPIIQIQGGCDVWSAVSLSTDDNPKFCTYVVPSGSHMTEIKDLSPEDQEKCMKQIREWME